MGAMMIGGTPVSSTAYDAFSRPMSPSLIFVVLVLLVIGLSLLVVAFRILRRIAARLRQRYIRAHHR